MDGGKYEPYIQVGQDLPFSSGEDMCNIQIVVCVRVCAYGRARVCLRALYARMYTLHQLL